MTIHKVSFISGPYSARNLEPQFSIEDVHGNDCGRPKLLFDGVPVCSETIEKFQQQYPEAEILFSCPERYAFGVRYSSGPRSRITIQ